MAHLRRATTLIGGNNAIGKSSEKTQKRATKILNKLLYELKNEKVDFFEGVVVPTGLMKEADEAYNEMVAKRAFYEQGKRDGKLWTPEQKLASKQRKAEERKAKRLAAKSA